MLASVAAIVDQDQVVEREHCRSADVGRSSHDEARHAQHDDAPSLVACIPATHEHALGLHEAFLALTCEDIHTLIRMASVSGVGQARYRCCW